MNTTEQELNEALSRIISIKDTLESTCPNFVGESGYKWAFKAVRFAISVDKCIQSVKITIDTWDDYETEPTYIYVGPYNSILDESDRWYQLNYEELDRGVIEEIYEKYLEKAKLNMSNYRIIR